ncbi:MAG: hypothetical protein E7291_02645 [Lachnospiraceae bacterium]|nr:hypothetical protein [Lachnospiraceae bacterium]
MEIIMFLAAMLLFLFVIYGHEAYKAKKREQQFIESLYQDYGKLPDKEYSPERYVRIASYYKNHIEDGQIDDITWNDLNMDDIFKRINYTFSASGEEYLYYTLRNINRSKQELIHLEEVVKFFEEHPDERVKIQFLMSRLGHTGKYSLYDYLDNLDYLGERSSRKHILMDLLYIPLLLLMPFRFSLAMMGIIVLIIYNMVSYFKEKGEIEPYIISFAYIMRLIDTAKKMTAVAVPTCSNEWQEIKQCVRVLDGMKRGSFWVFTTGKNATSGNPLDMILDYLKMIFHVDLIKFNKMLSQLQLHLKDIDSLITLVGYVESAIAIGALRASLEEYSVPELLETETKDILSIKDAYHLLIENPVKNNITTDRGVLLTGSNASGKSTFLKTVALNAILAQTIHTCTASEYRAPFFAIYSSMSLRDSIDSGESYYIVEIKALKRILDAAEQSDRRVLCFVDEVLRGTNTVERIAASTQILLSLAADNILCFAATHDIEMTELLKDFYENYHFEEDIREGDVFFNYRLMQGKAVTRNAIKLLEIMGYDAAIIEKATVQAQRFVTTGNWEPV